MNDLPLYTRDGELVVTIKVPVFNPMPEVIMWGSRTFVKDITKGKYFEGMTWVAPVE